MENHLSQIVQLISLENQPLHLGSLIPGFGRIGGKKINEFNVYGVEVKVGRQRKIQELSWAKHTMGELNCWPAVPSFPSNGCISCRFLKN